MSIYLCLIPIATIKYGSNKKILSKDTPTKKNIEASGLKFSVFFFIQTKLSHNGQPVIITNSNVCFNSDTSSKKRKHERK